MLKILPSQNGHNNSQLIESTPYREYIYRIFDRKVTLRPFLGHFHIIKGDKSKNVSGYGLFEYIGEEKIVRKNYRKNAFGEQSTPKTAFFIFDQKLGNFAT